MQSFIKKGKNYIIGLAALFVFVSLSGPTYSLFLKENNTDTFNYNTGNLDLEFIENEKIVIDQSFPVIDSVGMKQSPYKLTIKNTGSIPYLFDLKMYSSTSQNVIDTKYIKVKINDELPHTLYQTSNTIAEDLILYPGSELSFEIRIWLDINTPNTELGKTFSAKIVTEGSSIYKTLDVSGANHPQNNLDFIPVYYSSDTKTWNKADKSNSNSSYQWYDYNNQMWANAITIKESEKQIYSVTGDYNIKLDNPKINSGNLIIDDSSLTIPINNFSSSSITSIFRVKIDELKDEVYFMNNDTMSYYYDTNKNKFIMNIGANSVSSSSIELESNKWYILGYTYNGSEVSFYLNGDKISTANIYGSLKSNSNFEIGKNSKMTLGDIYIYTKVLSNEEINKNYKNSINLITDNLLVGYNQFTPMTLKEYYINAPLGTPIKASDIAGQYVWIPRFKYQVWNVTGESGIDTYDAYHKGIAITFENGLSSSGTIYCQNELCYSDEAKTTEVTQNDNGKYYTHPGFNNLNNNTLGFWVSKYEISTSNCTEDNSSNCLTNDAEITVSADAYPWVNNYLSNFYQAIKKFNNNSHMIKNTEWGAISYLTHSKYGVCQNSNCSELTSYDSTTNNIYGVFNLSGSMSEFVMASTADSSNQLNLTNSHFSETPIVNNDYDLYTSNKFILGDATKELSLTSGIWFANESNYPNQINNWFVRGGTSASPGLFSYNASSDTNSKNITTRITINNN